MCFPIEILAFAALDWSISDGCEGPAFPILGKAGRLKRWRPNAFGVVGESIPSFVRPIH